MPSYEHIAWLTQRLGALVTEVPVQGDRPLLLDDPSLSYITLSEQHQLFCVGYENGAAHVGQRWSISPPQAGQSVGISASNSVNQRRAEPHFRQIAVQSPSTFLRSSRSQSEAFPMG